MKLNTNYKDIAIRALKTFLQAAVAVLIIGAASVPAIIAVGLISALISVLMNLLNITPESIQGRAASTFLQTFLAAWAVSGYEFTYGVVASAAAAAISAVFNFVKETSL